MTDPVAPKLSDVFRAELRAVVDPLVRSHGFKGSSPRWTLSNSHGDVALVQTELSRWNTDESVSGDVWLALVPAPLWTHRIGDAKRPSEAHGLYRSRLETPTGSTIWRCTDVQSVTSTVSAMGVALGEAIERLIGLLDRTTFRAQLASGDGLGNMGEVFFSPLEAEVILLSDQPGPDLEAALDRLLSDSPKERVERHPRWVDWVWDLAKSR